jgi:hypothetical protein
MIMNKDGRSLEFEALLVHLSCIKIRAAVGTSTAQYILLDGAKVCASGRYRSLSVSFDVGGAL